MEIIKNSDQPFPLKKYYFLYGGIGSVLFYILLFTLFVHAERAALYKEYTVSVSDKAKRLYLDLKRNFLKPHNLSIEDLRNITPEQRQVLRKEIKDMVNIDFSLAQIKLFTSDGITLYDHSVPENEGKPYDARHEEGFIAASRGSIASDVEVSDTGQRLMEAYLPILKTNSNKVISILEIYEDVTRFENQVQQALQDALLLPTCVFIIFNLVLYLIIVKADRIITERTNLLITIRKNMEKYLSQSAVQELWLAVSEKRELFQGEKKSIVILFSDIRGFTSYSEKTEPEIVVKNLNKIFQLQEKIVLHHGGVIDKFVGDEMMVTFPAGSETNGVTAAIEILQSIQDDPDVHLSIGIGLHSGEAVVGSIGTENRKDYTSIGDTINVGARICVACPADSLMISSDAYKGLNEDLKKLFHTSKDLSLKGKSELVKAHLYQVS